MDIPAPLFFKNMEQQVFLGDIAEKEKQVEFVKQWVVDLYESGVFYSFSLHTLELSRRFNSSYIQFRQSKSPEDFKQLQNLAEVLEKRLTEEKRL